MIKRVVVAGNRNFTDYEQAKKFIDICIDRIRKKYTLIFVSGCCRGTDSLGERYAKENGFKVEKYPADWKTYGRSAGPIRNKKMAEISDYIICFWDEKSKGTRSMIDYAKEYGKPLKIRKICIQGSDRL